MSKTAQGGEDDLATHVMADENEVPQGEGFDDLFDDGAEAQLVAALGAPRDPPTPGRSIATTWKTRCSCSMTDRNA